MIKAFAKYAEKIAEYRAEFPAECERVTYDPSRIPGRVVSSTIRVVEIKMKIIEIEIK